LALAPRQEAGDPSALSFRSVLHAAHDATE